MKEWIMMNCPSMENMAKQVCELVARPCINVNIKWETFSDGFPNLFIENARVLSGKPVVVILSFYNKSELFEQLSIIYALPRHAIRSLIVVLCYFPTGTMERVDVSGQIATAKTLSRMLCCTPATARGPPQILIYDIHSLQEQFYFADSIIPQLHTAIPLINHKLEVEYSDEPMAIAFPDEGAFKRFSRLVPSKYPTIICMKVRKGDKRIVSIMEGEPLGKHVIIIDDLVQSGGTLLNCKNVLLENGALKVSCFVTHAVFPKDSWKKFIEEPKETRFSKFFVTDSCPEVTDKLKDKEPFEILPLAPSIAKFIEEQL